MITSTLDIDWESLNKLTGAALKKATFKAFQEASFAIQYANFDDPKVLETVPRLAALVNRHEDLSSYRGLVSSLARSAGLWNYIDTEIANIDDALIAESVTSEELDGITFHREQINALNTLLSGQNLILSAPTSFGKSLLIDALLATGRYQRIAIVLPTIALLDEFRRRLTKRFSGKFQIMQ